MIGYLEPDTEDSGCVCVTFCTFEMLNYLYTDNFDAIWENLPLVAQGNFAEIKKLVLKLLCFSLFLTIFNFFGFRYHRENN